MLQAHDDIKGNMSNMSKYEWIIPYLKKSINFSIWVEFYLFQIARSGFVTNSFLFVFAEVKKVNWK